MSAGIASRLVRRYGIRSHNGPVVILRWQEKFVNDPDNSWHYNRRSGGWRRRQITVSVNQLEKHYSRCPPA